ncbi:MAG TPA: hypothetical protein VLT59_04900, partial [Steroidobacteraceae bacterium]|nr:hypothetical protein [Steroidobacteraceae bacterium]
FVHPDGRSWSDVSAETRPRQTDWTRIPELNRDQVIAIDPNTARTRWLGETMDYGLAVDALLQRRRKAQAGSTA